jgi:hypothetical protein
MNRDTESVVVLTPNIGLTLTSRRSSVGIDAALNLCDALLVTEDHRSDCDRAAYEDSDDRNQQTTQARD